MSRNRVHTISIYLIAGEPSGDVLGATLMEGLRQVSRNDLEFHGIGGKEMASQGLETLFPINKVFSISVFKLSPTTKVLLLFVVILLPIIIQL